MPGNIQLQNFRYAAGTSTHPPTTINAQAQARWRGNPPYMAVEARFVITDQTRLVGTPLNAYLLMSQGRLTPTGPWLNATPQTVTWQPPADDNVHTLALTYRTLLGDNVVAAIHANAPPI